MQRIIRSHLKNFLKMFDRRAGYEIKPCYRSSMEGKCEAKLCATQKWLKNEKIEYLIGAIGELSPNDHFIGSESVKSEESSPVVTNGPQPMDTSAAQSENSQQNKKNLDLLMIYSFQM